MTTWTEVPSNGTSVLPRKLQIAIIRRWEFRLWVNASFSSPWEGTDAYDYLFKDKYSSSERVTLYLRHKDAAAYGRPSKMKRHLVLEWVRYRKRLAQSLPVIEQCCTGGVH